MNVEELYDYFVSIPGVEPTFPFDEVTLVMKLMGKMIALIPLDAEVKTVSLKCDPDKAVELRQRYSSVQAAFHMHKRYWNSIELLGDMPDEEIMQWINHSIDEVVKKMPKKIQREYYGKGDE
ncbi:MAG TPA: MmcQ/YjbR family DNA-binding protein [Bacteroidales bacterium]|nr:MmcQ/YjbR family DNA-binding protein [Bacteroidales bacterium]